MSEAFERARAGQMAVGANQLAAYDDMMTQRTNGTAGNALMGGDYNAASSALYRGGNLQGGLAVQNAGRQRQAADTEEQKAAIAGAVSGLMHVPEAERAAMLQSRIAPLFQQLGMGDYLSRITPADLTDASLRALTVSMGGEVETGDYMNVGGGRVVQTRPYGSGVEEVYAAPVDPLDQEYRQAQIDAQRALIAQRQTSASVAQARESRQGRSRGGGGGGGGSRPAASGAARPATSTGGGLPPGFTIRRR